jgi:hypothetical protein
VQLTGCEQRDNGRHDRCASKVDQYAYQGARRRSQPVRLWNRQRSERAWNEVAFNLGCRVQVMLNDGLPKPVMLVNTIGRRFQSVLF